MKEDFEKSDHYHPQADQNHEVNEEAVEECKSDHHPPQLDHPLHHLELDHPRHPLEMGHLLHHLQLDEGGVEGGCSTFLFCLFHFSRFSTYEQPANFYTVYYSV